MIVAIVITTIVIVAIIIVMTTVVVTVLNNMVVTIVVRRRIVFVTTSMIIAPSSTARMIVSPQSSSSLSLSAAWQSLPKITTRMEFGTTNSESLLPSRDDDLTTKHRPANQAWTRCFFAGRFFTARADRGRLAGGVLFFFFCMAPTGNGYTTSDLPSAVDVDEADDDGWASKMPICNAKATDTTCMVLPPKLATADDPISLGIAIRWTGKPCKSNFSIGMIGRRAASTTT